MSNARQAMPAGGTLRIATCNHLTEAADSPAVMCQLTLSVSDTGSGLNPRVRPRIFEPFFTNRGRRARPLIRRRRLRSLASGGARSGRAAQSGVGHTGRVLTRQLTMPMAHELANVDVESVVSVPIDSRQLDATLQLALARPERSSQPASRERERALSDALDRVAAIVSEMGYSREVPSAPSLAPRLARLRPRERQVAQLLLAHHRVPAIARLLAISAQTVRNHLKSAFKRSGTRSQQELLDWLRSTDPAFAGSRYPRAESLEPRADS